MLDWIRNHRKKTTPNPNPAPGIPERLTEPAYVDRPYTSEELICIFEYALEIDFSNIQALRIENATEEEKEFFIELILYKISKESPEVNQTVDSSRFNVDADSQARISLNISAESIPYVLCSIVKRGMMNWNFLNVGDNQLRQIHREFKFDFQEAFDAACEKIKDKNLPYREFATAVNRMLSPLSEHRNPQLMYATEMMLISFITNLTVKGYLQEAKVLHTFLILSKRIISQAQADESNREKTVLMLSMPVLSGLRLWPETDRRANPFMTSMLNLALSHPIFNETYDPHVYLTYEQICLKLTEVDFNINTNPSLFERGADLPINADIIADYNKALELLTLNRDKLERQKVVLKFFKDAIARHVKFNGPKAEDVHNTIYAFGRVFVDDKAKGEPLRRRLYQKVLRQLIQVPSTNTKLDMLFDYVLLSSFIDCHPESAFNAPFNIEVYELSPTEVNHYCRQIQVKFHEANIEMTQLRAENNELKDLNKGYADDRKRIEAENAKLKDKVYQLESLEPTTPSHSPHSSKESSPPTTPPKERKVLSHHLKREKKSEIQGDVDPVDVHDETTSPPSSPKERVGSRHKLFRRKTESDFKYKPTKLHLDDENGTPAQSDDRVKIELSLGDVQAQLTQLSLDEMKSALPLTPKNSPPKEGILFRSKKESKSIESEQDDLSSQPESGHKTTLRPFTKTFMQS